jgi:crossover junction endodeoxyribonuclease RusA
VKLALPFPEKILWPNGRGHHMAKHRAFKKHKEWAHMAALAEIPRCFRWNGEPIRLRYTVTPKGATRTAIDKDNTVSAMKAYQDGIAAALVIDDSNFATPEIVFGKPEGIGNVLVEIGHG